jgi:hypothetical protein
MKYLFIAVLCFSASALAGGKLVSGAYYLDDVNQVVAPTLGLQLDGSLGPLKLSSYLGGGVIPQVDPNAPNTFARAALDLGLDVTPTWTVSVGGGLESAKAVYRQFDDYGHVNVSVKLW